MRAHFPAKWKPVSRPKMRSLFICAYSGRKPASTFAEYALANSPDYLEISKDRKAGAQGVVLLAKGFDREVSVIA